MSADKNQERLGLLRDAREDMSALLLASLAGTHRDVLNFDGIDEGYQLGIRSVSGTFTHKPTGQRYIVAVCAIPLEA